MHFLAALFQGSESESSTQERLSKQPAGLTMAICFCWGILSAVAFHNSDRSWIREDWQSYISGMLRLRRFRVKQFVDHYLPFAVYIHLVRFSENSIQWLRLLNIRSQLNVGLLTFICKPKQRQFRIYQNFHQARNSIFSPPRLNQLRFFIHFSHCRMLATA